MSSSSDHQSPQLPTFDKVREAFLRRQKERERGERGEVTNGTWNAAEADSEVLHDDDSNFDDDDHGANHSNGVNNNNNMNHILNSEFLQGLNRLGCSTAECLSFLTPQYAVQRPQYKFDPSLANSGDTNIDAILFIRTLLDVDANKEVGVLTGTSTATANALKADEDDPFPWPLIEMAEFEFSLNPNTHAIKTDDMRKVAVLAGLPKWQDAQSIMVFKDFLGQSLFRRLGLQARKIHLPKDSVTGALRGCVFVSFQSEHEAHRAVAGIDGFLWPRMGNLSQLVQQVEQEQQQDCVSPPTERVTKTKKTKTKKTGRPEVFSRWRARVFSHYSRDPNNNSNSNRSGEEDRDRDKEKENVYMSGEGNNSMSGNISTDAYIAKASLVEKVESQANSASDRHLNERQIDSQVKGERRSKARRDREKPSIEKKGRGSGASASRASAKSAGGKAGGEETKTSSASEPSEHEHALRMECDKEKEKEKALSLLKERHSEEVQAMERKLEAVERACDRRVKTAQNRVAQYARELEEAEARERHVEMDCSRAEALLASEQEINRQLEAEVNNKSNNALDPALSMDSDSLHRLLGGELLARSVEDWITSTRDRGSLRMNNEYGQSSGLDVYDDERKEAALRELSANLEAIRAKVTAAGDALEVRRKQAHDRDNRGQEGGADTQCCICRENEKEILLLPCRHLCLCTQCSLQPMSSCPICRQNVVDSIKVWL